MADSLYDYLPLSVLFVFCEKMGILYPIGTGDVYSLGKFSLIDKKVFWIYNIYGIVMNAIKMRNRIYQKCAFVVSIYIKSDDIS